MLRLIQLSQIHATSPGTPLDILYVSIFHFSGIICKKDIKMVIRRATNNGMKDYEQ